MAYALPNFNYLGVVTGINCNATGDTLISITAPKYVVTALYLYDFSTTPSSSLAATLRDAVTGGGNSLVGSITGLNSIATTAIGALAVPSTSALGAYRQFTASGLYFNISVANGSALTCSAMVLGVRLK